MPGREIYDEVVAWLEASKATVRCSELTKRLRELGFRIRDGKKGGHKTFVHDGIPAFYSGSYDCGHGANPEIKPAYISNILRILRLHEAEIVKYLEEKDK